MDREALTPMLRKTTRLPGGGCSSCVLGCFSTSLSGLSVAKVPLFFFFFFCYFYFFRVLETFAAPTVGLHMSTNTCICSWCKCD